MKLPDEFTLNTGGYYDEHDDPRALHAIKDQHIIIDKILAGTMFVKFIDGDRKGSIARVHLDKDQSYQAEPKARMESMRSISWNPVRYEIKPAFLFLIAKWDKRKNSCKITMPDRNVVFLPNYEGPTVYQMFDKKAAKEELLKDPKQLDIDGKLLAIGDKVLYINARYGSGFRLTHGTIVDFKAVVDSSGHVISTIIEEDDTKLISSITYCTDMIWKK